jgi:hypothetical protein
MNLLWEMLQEFTLRTAVTLFMFLCFYLCWPGAMIGGANLVYIAERLIVLLSRDSSNSLAMKLLHVVLPFFGRHVKNFSFCLLAFLHGIAWELLIL